MLLLDRLESRLEPGRAAGAELLAAVRRWAGGDGPEVVVEATGVPELVSAAVEIVSPAGRVVVVGLSRRDAPLRVGALPFKEIDVLGVSCCGSGEFAEAVELVSRRREVVSGLVTHEFPLDEDPEAIAYAMHHPVEVMKAVVRLDAR